MKTTVFAGSKVILAVLVGALAPWASGCAQDGDAGHEGAVIDEPVGEAHLASGATAQDTPDSIKKFEGLNQEADVVANGGTNFMKKFSGFDHEADVVANEGASFVKKFQGLDMTGDIVENDLLGPNMKDVMARAASEGSFQGDIVENDLLGPDMKSTM